MATRKGFLSAPLLLSLCICASAAEKTSAPGDASALFRRANFYRSAASREQDPALAFRWMQEAARKGLPAAQYEVAKMFLEARGTPFDFAQGNEWLRKAAGKDKRAAALLNKVAANPPQPPAPVVKRAVTVQPLALAPAAAARNGAAGVMDAAARGDMRALEALLLAGAGVEASGPDGATPLMAAAESGRVDAMRLLLARRADPNARSRRGETALSLSVRARHPGAAALLLDRGDIGQPALDDALSLAADNCDEAMSRLLLEKGAEARTGKTGETPLMRAAGRCSVDVAELLALAGPIDVFDKAGHTALWIAAQRGDGAIVAMLLARGAARDAAGADGVTPLLAALMQGRETAALSLVKAGANIEAQTNSGATPLILAAQHGLEAAVDEALSRGADPNARDALGVSALMAAAKRGNAKILCALLEKGADRRLRNKKRETAIELAADDRIRGLLVQ